MNSLITACLSTGNISLLAKFPTQLTYPHETELVNSIIRYTQRFGKVPSIERVTRKFPTFVAMYPEANQPLEDILEVEIEDRRREMAVAMVGEIDNALMGDGEIPMEKINDLATLMGITSGGIEDYAEFDRDEYFRSNDAGLSWGFDIFDHATGRIREGEVALLAGRLGVGKTTLLRFIVKRWYDEGHRILYISNESSVMDVFLGLDAIIGRFNPLSLRRGGDEANIIRGQMSSIQSIARSTKGQILVPSSRLLTPASIAAKAKFLGVDVIVIDGIYLLQANHQIANKYERIGQVSNEIKQMALDLNVRVFGATQIKRGAGEGGQYGTEDLSFSDALGQDADFVVSTMPTEEKGTFEASFIKNRYGPAVATAYSVNFDTMTLTEVEISDEEEDWHRKDKEDDEDSI